MQMVHEPEVLHGYAAARRKTADALHNLSFARVVSIVQMPNKSGGKDIVFQGEVEEVFSTKHATSRGQVRHAYFSKFSRNDVGVNVLGCFNIIDSPMGSSHPSSLPQMGDVLVGSFVNAVQRNKLPFEFKGWCNNGKPLLELMRILEKGSRMSKGELHALLRQPASITAAFALRLQGPSMRADIRTMAEQAVKGQDDIWLLARALCFKELDIDERLKLSKPHFDILHMLAMTTLDEEMLDDIQKIAPPPPPVEVFKNPFDTYKPDSSFLGAYGSAHGLHADGLHADGLPYTSIGNRTPPYGSSSPICPSSPKPRTPEYQPSSPTFAPSSPTYPTQKTSFTPSSPPYRPSPQRPTSPPYCPPQRPSSPPSRPESPSSARGFMVDAEEGEVEKPSILRGLLNKINGIKDTDL